jgi:hypothetical protein
MVFKIINEMKKNLFITVLFFLMLSIESEGQVFKPANDQYSKMSAILPPAPNASAISKYGGVDIDLSSGTINKEIQLRQFEDKKLNVPISLRYTSNGIKANEYPSRIGMGWSFHAGGQISRLIRGKDDLTKVRSTLGYDVTPNEDDPDVTTYSWKVINESKDGEPDIFSFDFGNYSGKFVFDHQGIIRPLIATNLSIEYTPYGSEGKFIITTPEGVAYYFGNVIEQTRFGGGGGANTIYNQYVTNVWYLTKIKHPAGYFSTLTYETEDISNYIVSKEETQFKLSPDAGAPLCIGIDCVDGLIYNYPSDVFMSAKVARLKEIVSSFGSKVLFTYSTSVFPERLLLSVAYNNENNVQVSKYVFSYNTTVSWSVPFLTNIKEYGSDNVQMHNGHSFQYYNMGSVPARLTLSQDHWGYYNGKTNTTLIAKPEDDEMAYDFPGALANRDADAAYAVYGLLTEIVYPTGGKDVVEYESNKGYLPKDINGFSTINGAITGTGSTFVETSPVTFTVGYDKIRISTYCFLSGDGSGQGRIIISNNVGTPVMTEYFVADGNLKTEFIYLAAGTYTLKVGAQGQHINTDCTIKSRNGSGPDIQDVEINMGGMRVKKVSTYDNALGTPMKKRYYYGTLNDLNHASSTDIKEPNYFTPFTFTVGFIDGVCAPTTKTYAHKALHYTPLNKTYIQDGLLMKYTSVIESFGGDNFENGAVEHKFSFVSDIAAQPIRGWYNLEAPVSNNSYASPGEIETNTYKKVNGSSNPFSLVPVSSVLKNITIDTARFKKIMCLNVHMSGDLPCALWSGANVVGPSPLIHQIFHISKYYITSAWKYISKETNKQFDVNGLNPTITVNDYYYDNANNLLLTRIESTDSKGLTLKKVMQYPHDFVASGNVYERMVARNIIQPVIKQEISRNNQVTFTEQTNYADEDWFIDKHLVAVKEILTKKGTFPSNTVFKNYKYDAVGNTLEFSNNDNNIKQSFIWGYSQYQPVAKVVNADYSNIAYTSFEDNMQGNWSYSGAISSNLTDVPTGKKYYNLSGGQIFKPTANAAINYVVSYWSMDGIQSVSNTISNKTGVSINGWTYFEHEVTGNTYYTVSGTGRIDELRFYPKGSQMSTVTYEPLVGVTSECDINNRIIYYIYDNFGRLIFTRDQNRNIIKKFCYNYVGQPEDCTTPCLSTNPLWQNTAQPLICQQGSCGNTGFQLQEQLDINVCSLSYGQTQWVESGYNATACPASANIFITYTNTINAANYVAVYTNTVTSQVYTFTIPAGSGTLGCLPSGIYNLNIHKTTSSPPILLFSCGSNSVSGTSADFYNVNLGKAFMRSITLDNGF